MRTTTILGHCSRSPGQDSNTVLPEQETRVLVPRQWWSVQGLRRIITEDESSKCDPVPSATLEHSTLAQPVARGRHVARDTVLCCLRRHLEREQVTGKTEISSRSNFGNLRGV